MRRGSFLLAFLLAGTARAAPTLDECVTASEDAQLDRLKGHLIAARDKLKLCSDEACPKLVKHDCSAWFDEVEQAMPSVVFNVQHIGRDLTDVRVLVDGSPVATRLDGKSIAIDVGTHTLRFEATDLPPHEETILVREGEKARNVFVELGERAPAPVITVPHDHALGPWVGTWVLGGLGLASLGAAGVVGLVSLEQYASLSNRCGAAEMCAPSDRDGVQMLYDIAYATAAVGGGLAIASAIAFFATRRRAPPATAIFVTPSFTQRGFAVGGTF